MKRILSFVLCGVLCLSLCACGASDGGEHRRLLSMLDEHDYTGAVNYINNLAYEYAQENKDSVADAYVYTAALYGEWVAYNAKEGTAVPRLVFNEDGTCIVGENTYLWEAGYETTTNLDITILDGAERVHSFSISKNTTTGAITGSSSNIPKDTWLNFYNPAHYEVAEVTVDNFADYFDDVDFFTYNTNSFDEVTDIYANKQWKLKGTYYSRLWTGLTEVAVEYRCQIGSQPARWDLAARTCELTGEWTPNTKDPADSVRTNTEEMGDYFDASTSDPDDSYFGLRYLSTGGWTNADGETYFANYYHDVTLTRVQGSLYLVKEEIKNLVKTEE